MLVIDAGVPVPNRDAGSLRLYTLLQLLNEGAWHIDLFVDDSHISQRDVTSLAGIGVTLQADSISTWLQEHGTALDLVMLCRMPIAAQYIGLIRRRAAQAMLVFDTVDLHFLREQRAADIFQRRSLQRQAASTRRRELALIQQSDLCLVVSEEERLLLAAELPASRVEVLSTIHRVHGRQADFDQRRDLLFVGGFGHPPNLDGMRWFTRDILPQLRLQEHSLRLHIIGDLTPEARQYLNGAGVELHGRIEDLAPLMKHCRVSVAPLRFGAGVKGKVNMAMSYGLPVVATSIAAEGMHLTDGVDVLIADDVENFVSSVLRAYRDPEVWLRLSDAGLSNVQKHFSPDLARQTIHRLFPGRAAPGERSRHTAHHEP